MAENLQQAAAAVRSYIKSNKLTENTVLAGYLRSRGHTPNGEVWMLAKMYREQGYSFSAAATAAERTIRGESIDGIDKSGVPSGADLTRTNEDLTRTNEVVTETEDALSVSDLEFVDDMPVSPVIDVSLEGVKPLDWYPKRYSPGDIDGDGAKKLLGTPSIPLASVLVRETAQNSWDARTGLTDVEFTLNIKQLTMGQTDVLREICLPEEAVDVEIVEALDKPIWVLEISDRGTYGLRGPTRNDLEVDEGQPTNFIDLVFNLGGKHEVDSAGGTYGFGKTIAYKASQLGAILIWSRINENGRFEDRMIGSAIGDRFNMDGYRYTGRHWWGRFADDTVQPLKDRDAVSLGHALFSRAFEGQETGTSILVLMPDLGGGSPENDAKRLAEAVRWHLWPKMLEAQGADVRLNIDVKYQGRSVQIFPTPGSNPVLDSLAMCLRSVRATQSGSELPNAFPPVKVEEVWCQRPSRLLGHVAFQRFQDRDLETLAEDVVPFEKPNADHPVRYVALMRNEAELVVKYTTGPPLEVPGFSWVGVFKPVADMDKVFAASEPPAHDEWVPEGVGYRQGATFVRVGLKRIRELAQAFAQPLDRSTESRQSSQSVAGLADALSDLIPQVSAARPEPRPSTTNPRRSASRRPRAEITDQFLGPASTDGTRLVALRISAEGTSLPARLGARGSIGVEGGSDEASGEVQIVGWHRDRPDLTSYTAATEVADSHLTESGHAWLVLRADADLALDIEVEVVT